MAARKKSCKCKKGSGMKIDIAKQLAKCGLDIYKIVEYVFDKCQRQSSLSLDVILDVDRTARELARNWMRINC